MKLRLVSDGTAQGTRLEDENGRKIEGVASIRVSVSTRDMVEVEVMLVGIPIDMYPTGATVDGIFRTRDGEDTEVGCRTLIRERKVLPGRAT